jgi:hypothetical protein
MPSRTSPALKDRRGAPRSDSSLAAYLITPSGHQLRGVARNLSRSGVFMESRIAATAEEWLVGESARMVFMLADGNVIRLIRYPVLIVREARHGIGMAFCRSMRPAPFRPHR